MNSSFTDTLGDILEGNRVGVETIAVDFGFHKRDRLEKSNPFKIVFSFDEVVSTIKSIFRWPFNSIW